MNHGGLAVGWARSFHCARYVASVRGVHSCVHVSLCENLVESRNNTSPGMYAEHARGRTLGTIELLGYAILLITRQHFPYPVVAHRSMVFIHSRDKERVRCCFVNTRFVYYFAKLIVSLAIRKALCSFVH